jgi:hypothetical protein
MKIDEYLLAFETICQIGVAIVLALPYVVDSSLIIVANWMFMYPFLSFSLFIMCYN